MKFKTFSVSFLLIGLFVATTILFTNCQKSGNEEKHALVKNGKMSTTAYIESARSIERARLKDAQARFTSNFYIAYETTTAHEVYIADRDSTYNIFYTKVYQDDKMENVIGSMIGYVLKDSGVFNVLYLANNPNTVGEMLVNVEYLGGNDIGSFTVRNDSLISVDIAQSPGDEAVYAQRSWWSCTTDCIGDAHIACLGDKECTNLLMIANIGGNYVKPRIGGAGSISISIACGAVCAANSDIDLLPQH